MPSALTARAVELLKPDPSKRIEIPDGALPGFYLIVQPTGAKSWAVRYRAAGKARKLTLGPYPRLGLGDAREAAREALQAVSMGKDPAAEKAEQAAVEEHAVRQTFGSVAEQFIARYAKTRNRTWRETERVLLRGDLAAWGSRNVTSIGRRDVLDVIDAVVDRGAPTQANRVFATLRRFFAWTVERGILTTTPMAGLKPPSPEVSRDRVLSDAELAAIWKAAEDVGYPFGRAVQMLILTGQRRSEVLEAEWSEFETDGALWTIPRTRAKNDTAHVVHLSQPALDILARLPRIGKPARFVFTTTATSAFSGVSKATANLSTLAAAHLGEPLADWRLHDLRRTFASGCARLGVAVHVVEKALNHTSGTFGGIVSVYQKHEFMEERAHALDAWAAHVIGLTKPRPAKVVPIRGGRR